MLTDDLLELQRLDTLADQLRHRRRTLPEREASNAAQATLDERKRRRVASVGREQELEMAIDALERDGEQLTSQRNRLEAQLRTVVAPREAEALMHELATIAERRDGLDDQELASLDEQSALADAIAALDAELPQLEAHAAAAATALAVAEAEIDGELATVVSARAELVGRLDGGTVDRYERLRERHHGVAVATLDGHRCSACHLDLSPAELGEVRSVGPGEFADCPHCGRLLVP